MYEGHMYGIGGGIMWLFWILLIAGAAWLIIEAFRGKDTQSKKTKSALEILEERYVRGEMDLREFEEKRRHLTG